MADDKQEPARDRQIHSHHLARGVIFRVRSILPEEPVSWKKRQTEGRHMLLEIEEALRFPVAGLLDWDADVDAILGVDIRAHDEREYPEKADCRGVAGRRHRTEARHESSGSCDPTHRH